MKSKFEILTGRSAEHLTKHQSSELLIDKDTEAEFQALKTELKLYEIDLQIVSSFRDYDRQAKIWNDKATGQRDLYSRDGKLLNYKSLGPKDILEAILSWSAIPGASRHHWGSDLDVFDSNIKQKSHVKLTNDEYESDFKNLTQSLSKERLSSHNFYRPYSEYRGGIAKELWHISYAPVSRHYLSEYSIEIFERNIFESEIRFKDILLSDLEFYYETYVLNFERK